MNENCPVIVMAKAPVAGFAKTRLIPALGAHGAAALAECLLERAIGHALEAQLGPVDLCCTPDMSHPALARHAAWHGMALSAQGDGDLGARMARAFDRWLVRAGRALMTGTDAPALDAAMLVRAAAALDEADAVFIPALDGGYALIGLRRAAPRRTATGGRCRRTCRPGAPAARLAFLPRFAMTAAGDGDTAGPSHSNPCQSNIATP